MTASIFVPPVCYQKRELSVCESARVREIGCVFAQSRFVMLSFSFICTLTHTLPGCVVHTELGARACSLPKEQRHGTREKRSDNWNGYRFERRRVHLEACYCFFRFLSSIEAPSLDCL